MYSSKIIGKSGYQPTSYANYRNPKPNAPYSRFESVKTQSRVESKGINVNYSQPMMMKTRVFESDVDRAARQCKHGPKSITTEKTHTGSAGGGGRNLIGGEVKRTNKTTVICNDPPKTNVRSAPKVKR